MSNTTQIALRVPDEILQELRTAAASQFRSVTSLAVALIARGLEAERAAAERQTARQSLGGPLS
jgi:hypothetical protein